MKSSNFQAMIWSNRAGFFRVKLSPYEYGDVKVYCSDLDEAGFRKFTDLIGAEFDGLSRATTPDHAIIVDDVALSEDQMRMLDFVTTS